MIPTSAAVTFTVPAGCRAFSLLWTVHQGILILKCGHGNFETLSSKKSPATQEEVCEVCYCENGFSETGTSCLGLVGRRRELLWSFRTFILTL